MALVELGIRGLVAKQTGNTVYTNGKFVAGANTYKYCPPFERSLGGEIPVDWDFQAETCTDAYVNTIRRIVPQEDWSKYFAKKEMEELRKDG